MRYRLPEILGGGEFEATDAQLWLPGMIRLRVGDSVALFDASVLTKVEPPLPPEPPLWTPVLVRDHEVFQRQPRGSRSAYSHAGFEEDYTWAEVCGGDVPRVLVPAPEPVELPWMAVCSADGEDVLSVGPPDSENQIIVKIRGTRTGELRAVYLDAEQARAGSRALWTAADAAENGGAP